MAKSNLKKLREGFDGSLDELWNTFDEIMSASPIEEMQKYKDPFSSTFWVDFSQMEADQREGVSYDIGWLEGVSAATGWSLDRPGPREWSPRRK